jgi:tryptophan synthase alpha chain
MDKIASVFKNGRKALIGYVTVGYPDIKATIKIARVLAENGCDIIELGIPFSDPLADGATIQHASHQALLNGVTPEVCLKIAAEISGKIDTPLLFMTYYNPVLNYGLDKFCAKCVEAGIRGLIVPDLPPEEGTDLDAIAHRHSLDMVYLLAPTSTDERIKVVALRSTGFVYLVSLTGVTGARENLSADLEVFVTRVRKKAKQPLCIGFGISTPEHAARAASIADGVIVGSRIIQLIGENSSLKALKSFITGLRQAIDNKKNTGRYSM